MRPLACERFELRPLGARDGVLYRGLYADPGAMRWIGAPQSADDTARGFVAALRYNEAQPARRRFWVIHDIASGVDLGLIGLDLDEPGGGEVGVVLPESSQGRGVATAAIALLAGHAFGEMGLLRLHTRHASGHGLAAGLMARLGFQQTAAAEGRQGWRWELTADRGREWPSDKPGSIR